VSAEIHSSVDAKIELIAGSGGVFDVVVDGKLLFSKAADHRFPSPGEIVTLMRASSLL